MKLTTRNVEDTVRTHFNIRRDLFISNRRDRKIARPRQIAMYLARKFTKASLPQIGMHFCKDHTTVLHACQRIEALIASNEAVAASVSELEEKLSAQDGFTAIAARMVANQPLVQNAV